MALRYELPVTCQAGELDLAGQRGCKKKPAAVYFYASGDALVVCREHDKELKATQNPRTARALSLVE